MFYRLNVASVPIPPLRERKEDIPPLAEHFLRQYCSKYHKILAFMAVTLDVLSTYAWSRNVRELQNAIHNLVITLNIKLIAPNNLPERVSGLPSSDTDGEIYTGRRSFREIIAEKEREFLQKAIEAHGSVQKVANLFHIDRSTIFRKLGRQASK